MAKTEPVRVTLPVGTLVFPHVYTAHAPEIAGSKKPPEPRFETSVAIPTADFRPVAIAIQEAAKGTFSPEDMKAAIAAATTTQKVRGIRLPFMSGKVFNDAREARGKPRFVELEDQIIFRAHTYSAPAIYNRDKTLLNSNDKALSAALAEVAVALRAVEVELFSGVVAYLNAIRVHELRKAPYQDPDQLFADLPSANVDPFTSDDDEMPF